MKNHNKHCYKPIVTLFIGFLYTISGIAQNNISVKNIPPGNNLCYTYNMDGDQAILDDQTGTYTITATYECRFLGCGPYQVTKSISVKDNLAIIAPSSNIVCQNETVQFSTNATTACQWSIFQNGQEINNPPPQSITLDYTFSQSGLYTVKVSNPDFCNSAEMTIEVASPPPAPTNISGPHEICPNSAEYFSASALGPDYYILWEWNDGTPTLATATGERVMITFGPAASDINVYQVNRRTGCRSTPVVWSTYLFQFDPWPYNTPIKVCDGEQFQLDLLPDHPDVPVLYVWTPLPEKALTVVGDHLQRNVTVLANFCEPAVPQASMILERTACETRCTKSVTVLIGQIDPPAVSPGPFCSNTNAQLNVLSDDDRTKADKSLSHWTINGVGTTYGIPANIVFPSAGTYSGTLHYVSRYGCTVQVPLSNIQVNSFPSLSLNSTGGSLCLSGVTIPDPDYHCSWSNGITDQQCILLPNEAVYCTVCSNVNSCCTTLHYTPPPPACTPAPGFSYTILCYNIVQIAVNNNVSLPATLHFYCSSVEVGHSVRISSNTQNVLIPQPCVDRLQLNWTSNNTGYCETINITPLPNNDWLDFKISSDCNGNIIITDNSTYSSSPWPTRDVTVTNINTHASQSDSFHPTDRLLSFPVLNSINTQSQFRIRITIGNSNCMVEYQKTFDPTLTITSISVPPLCDQTPALLSATAVGTGLEYLWHFGDDSYNFGESIYHTFGYRPTQYSISLTVTDINGCQRTMSQPKDISSNDIKGKRNILQDANQICFGDMRIMTYITLNNTFFDNIHGLYTWTPPVTETSSFSNYIDYALYEGGDYRVLETNPITGCKGEFTANIKYPNEIPANILCDDAYCNGEEALALGNAGNQYQYSWSLESSDNTTLGTSSNANYRFTVPQDVSCKLILAVSENGCTNTATKPIIIHPLPNTPTISFGTNACISDGPVQLTAPPSYPYLLWSNGTQGFSSTYYTDGHAAAYYIDNNGCRSPLGDIIIPRAPNFDGLLTGCYTVCDNANTPTAVYSLGVARNTPWTWYRDGNATSSGTVPMRPSPIQLSMPTFGTYRLQVVDYGNGCHDVSPPLTLTPLDCSSSIFGGSIPLDQRIACSVSKLSCRPDKCGVEYYGNISLLNLSSSAITVASISAPPAFPITLTPALPVTLAPGGTAVFSFSFTYDFSASPSVTFTLYDITGQPVGSLPLDLSNCIECLAPKACDFDIDMSLNLNTSLSSAGQAIFFDFTCTCYNPNTTVLRIWCDGPGEIVSAPMGSFPFTGTLMIGYGRLTQMVANQEQFCLYILCCIDGQKTCLKYVCFSASTLFQLSTTFPQNGKNDRFQPSGVAGKEPAGTRYRLSPNPTSGKVTVMDAATDSPALDIKEISVLSLLGTPLLVRPGGEQFDISSLPQGSYMVKITSLHGSVEHLRLVKSH